MLMVKAISDPRNSKINFPKPSESSLVLALDELQPLHTAA